MNNASCACGHGYRLLVAVVVSVMMLALLLPVAPPEHNRVIRAVWDLAHFPLMFLLAALIIPIGRRCVGSRCCFLIILCASLEIVQHLVGREGAVQDFAYGCSGIVLWMVCRMAYTMKGVRRVALMLIAFALVGISLVPVTAVYYDQVLIRRSFPQVASFESTMELGRWSVQGCVMERTTERTAAGTFAARIRFDEECAVPYPGLFLRELWPDWTKVAALHFDIFRGVHGPDAVHFRLDDKAGNPSYSDRFQMQIGLTSGWNHVVIPSEQMGHTPSGRAINFAQINKFGLFGGVVASNMSFVLDNVSVELR